MPTPWPGMDPYLGRRALWEELHTDLISHIRQFLIPLLRLKYRMTIEQRTYLAVTASLALVTSHSPLTANRMCRLHHPERWSLRQRSPDPHRQDHGRRRADFR